MNRLNIILIILIIVLLVIIGIRFIQYKNIKYQETNRETIVEVEEEIEIKAEDKPSEKELIISPKQEEYEEYEEYREYDDSIMIF